MTENKNTKPNRLIHATSPYLYQHAYNPVDWFEWGKEAFEKAEKEQKPILVSIGYSSCHWCHVMAHESFEDEEIAEIMNNFFVCIKVDREERPDVDHLYMEAVQSLGVNGGWPLNVFLTHDQKPFYGGTYFPPKNWAQILFQVHKVYGTQRDRIDNTANELQRILAQSDTARHLQAASSTSFQEGLEQIHARLSSGFDHEWGGMDKVPKFIMPSIWAWLLRYHALTKNQEALAHVLFTLKRISMGGIYDQLGGGFARYSVDGKWHVPHFEKMLYDNAQLISLYAEAYKTTRDEGFRKTIEDTLGWLQREMTHPQGGLYSALDADSEGVEGKYYCWTETEIDTFCGDDAAIVKDYFSIKKEGNWEHGMNIPIRYCDDLEFCGKWNLERSTLQDLLKRNIALLMKERDKRVRPSLDDKIVTSWNAMAVTGLVDAHHALGDNTCLDTALNIMAFLEKEMMEGTTLYRSYKGKRSPITGFLDDYAYVIQAYLKLYEATFEETWIKKAEQFAQQVMDHFYDGTDGYFFYTSSSSEKLIARKKEIFDNVIPASNSVMAQNLFRLGTLLDKEDWKALAQNMAEGLEESMLRDPAYLSHWGIVSMEIKKGLTETVIAGPEALDLNKKINASFYPFVLTLGSTGQGHLPLAHGKEARDGKTTLYVCHNKTCKRPVHTVEEAFEQY